MRRGTTPTITMWLPPEVSCAEISDAIFSIAQSGAEIVTKKFADMVIHTDDNTISVALTQEDTLSLNTCASAKLQVKVKINDTVLASDITTVSVGDILNEDVM